MHVSRRIYLAGLGLAGPIATVGLSSVGLNGTPATAMPQFAREYGLPCQTCHLHIPKLNEFGEAFAARGYRLPEDQKKNPYTLPATLWISTIGRNRQDDPDHWRSVLNRAKFITAGRTGKLSFMAEWLAVSKDILPDGSTRDNSGGFEDLLFFGEAKPGLTITAGQFRMMSQIDFSQKLHLSEPVVFGAALPGRPDTDPDIAASRGFAPGGRSVGLRAVYQKPDAPNSIDGWYFGAGVAFPGQFGVPVTEEARDSSEFRVEERAKGVFLETYRKKGLKTLGVNAFLGDNRRKFLGAAATYDLHNFYFGAGVARAEAGGVKEWRSSVWAEWIPSHEAAIGLRIDDRDLPGEDPALVPLVSLVKTKNSLTWRLIGEARLQKNRAPLYSIELRMLY